jgi:hypothetical protein
MWLRIIRIEHSYKLGDSSTNSTEEGARLMRANLQPLSGRGKPSWPVGRFRCCEVGDEFREVGMRTPFERHAGIAVIAIRRQVAPSPIRVWWHSCGRAASIGRSAVWLSCPGRMGRAVGRCLRAAVIGICSRGWWCAAAPGRSPLGFEMGTERSLTFPLSRN